MPSHRGATTAATVLLGFAAFMLALGIVAGIWYGRYANDQLSDSVGRSIVLGLAIALGSLVLASLLAFFGFVLDLLVEIAENTSV